MSYSAYYKNHRKFLDGQAETVSGEIPADCRDAAVKAVEAALATGALSSQGACDHAISISGHSNPSHEKTEGWARDYLQISITQIDVLPPKVKTVAEPDATGEPAE